MSKRSIKFILSLLMMFSLLSVLSYHTNITLYDLLTPLNADENYTPDENNNEESNLQFLHPYSGTSINVEAGSSIKLNKKKWKTYRFKKYDSDMNSIHLINRKNKVEIHYISDIQYISIRINDLEKNNDIAMILGGIAGGVIAFYPSAFAGFFSAMALDELLGGNWYQDGEGFIQPATCLGITALGTYYGVQIGSDVGANLGNPYIHISLKGNNRWEISSE